MRLLCFAIVFAASVLVAAPSRADTILSTFDTGAEGWTIAGDGSDLTWVATGGNPGGFIRATDLSLADNWFFQAGGEFYGDRSHYYGGTLSFDLKQDLIDTQYDERDVLISGGGITLAFDTAVNPGTNWTSYEVNLSEAGWRVQDLSGAAATQAQFQTVLANLTNLRIRGEYRTGPDAAGLDNAGMFSSAPAPVSAPVPLPAAVWGGMALMGLMGLTKLRHRRVDNA